ncbi:hypothetical protein JCM9279_005243 [Rhodotorula babjevae]
MHYASTSSLTVALVASAAIFASQAEALPTSRSTSTVARRAHIASHHSHAARAVPAASPDSTSTSLGDHSIVVDASTSADAGQGGIRNSTINLTSISKRQTTDREGTLSSFSRVVRSLFGRAIPAAPAVFKALPLTYSPPVSPGAAPSAASHKKRRSHHKKRRVVRQPRAGAPLKGNTRTLPSGLVIELGDTHTHHHVTNVKRRRTEAVAAAQLAHERRSANYTLAAAQASVYSAAVAALGDGEPTATPVLDAQAAAPTSFVNMTRSDRSSLNDTVGAGPAALSPVTLTITLVPSGIDGALVDAAFLRTATASASGSPSPATSGAAAIVRSSASSSISNPKASSTREASPDPTWTAVLAAVSAYTPPAAAAATASPPPAPASAALSAVKRGMERRIVARAPGARARRAPIVQAAQPVIKYYPAPA